jgi:hypothetical protein
MALTDYLKSIADAIRYAEGSTGEINAQMFAERIMALKVSDLPDEPSTDLIEVGKSSEYQYHTIKEAESAVSDGGTIRIYEGEYEEYGIGTVDKSITYEGVDKEKCIVLNGLSDKMYSVFDLTNGNKTVKNLTIHQTHSNPQNPNTETVAFKAYAVHCDSPSNEGHSYLIENCVLKNKYFACCGFGLWKDHTITVKDCDIDLYDSNRDITNTGAYYCHNNTYSNGVTGQRISLVNNTIHANQSKAIRIDTASQDGSEMVCEFINNTCISDLYGATTDCVSFAPNEHTILTETSAGNNIAKLNYAVEESYTSNLPLFEGKKLSSFPFIEILATPLKVLTKIQSSLSPTSETLYLIELLYTNSPDLSNTITRFFAAFKVEIATPKSENSTSVTLLSKYSILFISLRFLLNILTEQSVTRASLPPSR